jgi:hypothetical protein
MPILGVIASSTRQGQATDTGAMFPIFATTVSSAGASSITFSNIPSTYTNLQLRYSLLPSNANTYGIIRFNSDNTASNYRYQYFGGSGTNPALTNSAAQAYSGTYASTTAPAIGIIDFHDYKNTNKFKNTRELCGCDANGSGDILMIANTWKNTNAITSISISINSGNYAANSIFALYGIL